MSVSVEFLKNNFELEKLAFHYSKKAKIFLYDNSEIYSFGRIIKTYGYYPRFLPMPVLSDHSGPNFADLLYWSEKVDYNVDFFTHTFDKAKLYTDTQRGKGYVMYPPFLWYFKRKKVYFESLNREYITFIPRHSVPDKVMKDYIENGFKSSIPTSDFDFDALILEMLNIKSKGEKIRICLHFHDINKGFHKYFIDKGIEVVTAGNSLDDKFVDRFLNILFTSKYMVGNDLGTAFLYSTLFGIPYKFSSSIPILQYEGRYDRIIYDKIIRFNLTNLSPEIKEIVALFFNQKRAMSRLQTSFLLYRNLFRFHHIYKLTTKTIAKFVATK
jgi:hypothetical protein